MPRNDTTSNQISNPSVDLRQMNFLVSPAVLGEEMSIANCFLVGCGTGVLPKRSIVVIVNYSLRSPGGQSLYLADRLLTLP